MPLEILTKEDLELFRIRLLADMKAMLHKQNNDSVVKLEGYKTADVRKILGCSVNKLVSIRSSRKLRTKKIGGTLYYNKDDIQKLLEEGY